MQKTSSFLAICLLIACTLSSSIIQAAALNDPLPSWNEGSTKKAIIDFVHSTTNKKSPNYVEPQSRIATFDQDGTLWVEYPMYTEVLFAFDRVMNLSAKHPEWKETQPYKSLIRGDKNAIEHFTAKDIQQIILATHSGMSVEAFQKIVQAWFKKTKNARWHRPYIDLTYKPMIELMHYLRDNGYKTYIVTGGGQDFVRSYSEKVYGIPPEQVIGLAIATHYTYDNEGEGVLIKSPKFLLENIFLSKPEDIYLFIGRRPLAAFGNSNGDFHMLEYTQAGLGTRLLMLIHHDDAKREYDYGANSKIGTFSEALQMEAQKRGWIIVSMKNDWKTIFSFEK